MDYKKFIPDFKQYVPKMSKSDSKGFVPDYEKYLDMDKYTRFAKFMADAKGPTSAEKCNTTKQLDEWRTRMEAPMKAFVPKQWRDITDSHFEQEYKQNLKRIQAASAAKNDKVSEKVAPARLLLARDQGASGFDTFDPNFVPMDEAKDYSALVPDYEKYMNVQKYMEFAVLTKKQQSLASAEMCKTKAELDAWRKAREAPIKAFVPKDYQHYSMDSIKAEYNTNEARIEAAEKELRQQLKEAAAKETKPPARMLLEASAEATKGASEAEQAEQPQQPQMQKDGKAFDYEQFVPDYAKYMDYQKYMKFAQFMQDTQAPNKAQDCKSKADLKAWRSGQEATTKEFVPKEWQDAPMASIQEKYESNLARIKAEKADQPDTAATDTESGSASDDKAVGFHWPVVLATRFAALHAPSATSSEKLLVAAKSAESQKYVPNYANYMDVEKFAAISNSVEEMHAPEHPSDCKTLKDLDAWFTKQKAILKKYVPSAYQKHYSDSLEKKYKSSEARIKAVASTTATDAPTADQLAAVATPMGLPFVACGGVLVAMVASCTVALARRARQDGTLEENLLSHDAPLAA